LFYGATAMTDAGLMEETRELHLFTRNPLTPPYPVQLQIAEFALGCFWGAEQRFWQLKGVWTTAVGYTGGKTLDPTYEEVCSGQTGHAEVVRVVYDSDLITYPELLACFWEGHDPTQGMRQGNDIGTQYRSSVYYADREQEELARRSLELYQAALSAKGGDPITTEIVPSETFYFAESYHQQYLGKNPGGYCGHGGTGVPFPLKALCKE